MSYRDVAPLFGQFHSKWNQVEQSTTFFFLLGFSPTKMCNQGSGLRVPLRIDNQSFLVFLQPTLAVSAGWMIYCRFLVLPPLPSCLHQRPRTSFYTISGWNQWFAITLWILDWDVIWKKPTEFYWNLHWVVLIQSVIGRFCDSVVFWVFQDFISTVDSTFPYVTLVLSPQAWPPLIPTSVGGLSQRVALHLNAASLPRQQEEVQTLMDMMDRYDVIVQQDTEENAVVQQLVGWHRGKTSTHLYLLPAQF